MSEKANKVTQFWDMHSGGGQKLDWARIYIEAPEEEAKVIFYNRFGRNPERVTCTCCGEDYSISESWSLSQASAYHRGCEFYGPPRGKDGLYHDHNNRGRYFEDDEEVPDGWIARHAAARGSALTVADYIKKEDVLFVPASEIKDEERDGDVPDEGYVWV